MTKLCRVVLSFWNEKKGGKPTTFNVELPNFGWFFKKKRNQKLRVPVKKGPRKKSFYRGAK